MYTHVPIDRIWPQSAYKKKNIPVIVWPVHSADLNLIENIWVILTRPVFANGRQLNNKNDLKEEILNLWSFIKPKDLSNHIKLITDQ